MGKDFYDYTLITQFCKKYLGDNYTNYSYYEYLEIINTEEYQNMSLYPDKSSIKIINDIVVVKIK